ncbi:MAG: hypothetical protein ACO29O_04520, partial [Chitinophagaceae bacterium]
YLCLCCLTVWVAFYFRLEEFVVYSAKIELCFGLLFYMFISFGLAFPIFIMIIFNVDNETYHLFAVVVALMVILTHQKNISRLLKGIENKAPILKYRDRRRDRRSQWDA